MSKERFVLSGSFYGQTIKDKELVYAGDNFTLQSCNLVGCTVKVEGEASKGVDFMKKMFNAGMKRSVMKTFLTNEEYEIVKDALGWHGKNGN